MLLNDFFRITNVQKGDSHTLGIELNAGHQIFKGHFPGNPITPGVCLAQMVKESMEYITHKKLVLKQGSNLKFTAVLNPNEHPTVTINIQFKEKEDQLLYADSRIFAGDTVFFTFKGTFQVN
jgi:3-hydroxyacyl-[acyl-carrier-protein] dehydratase